MNPSPSQAQHEVFTKFSDTLFNPDALKTLERSYLKAQKQMLEGLLELIDRRLHEIDRTATSAGKRASKVPLGD
jgi:hypothetical protein